MSSVSKMIAFLCHPYHRGGVTRWMADGANEALNQGYEVYFITVTPKAPFFSAGNRPRMVDLISTFPLVKLIAPLVDFTFEFGSEEYKSYCYAKAIIKNLPIGVPIIISDDPSVWQAASLVSKRNPMIAVLHSDDQPYFDLANKFYRTVKTFVSVSSRIVNKCKTYPSLKDLNIPVIPCGIVLPSSDLAKLTKNKNLSLVWVGRIEEVQKRVSDLPKLGIELNKRGIDFTLDIIGEGSETKYIKDQIKINNLTSKIIMHGWLDSSSIYKKLQSSDILVLPSNYEGMPISVMEALACGCSIVSSKVSGIEDYETNPSVSDCLRVYSIGDIHSATDKIIELSLIPEENRRKSAMVFAHKEFSIQKSIERYMAVIEVSVKNFSGSYYSPTLSFSLLLKSKIISLLRYYKITYLK